MKTVIINPRITEKATTQSELGVYTFEVAKNSSKPEIAAAVKALFKVMPIKVAIVPIRSKKINSKGKRGKTASSKKAYVYLKKGDKIEFV